MLAQAREVHHKGVFELAVHLFLHGFEVTVAGAFLELTAEQFLPVRAPVNFIHPLAADQRAWAGGRQIFSLRRVVQMLVIVGERFVVIVNHRQHRVGEYLRQHANPIAEAGRQFTADAADPAALPLLLVFPVFG